MRRMPRALALPILCVCYACAAVALQAVARQQPAAPSTGHEYVLGPDSQLQPGVPAGKVMQHSWTSKIYPGTVRDYWVYVPAQYDAAKPACVMVFQDGAGYVKPDGGWRVPVV